MRMLVRARELDAIRVRLLEVVADDLVRVVAAVEVLSDALVQFRPVRLRYPAVGDVADEDVMEAEAAFPLVNESAALETAEIGVLERAQIFEVYSGEQAPEHGRAAYDFELSGTEAVEPTCDQRFDRRRSLVERHVGCFRRKCQQLFGKERIPACVLDDPLFHVGCDRSARELLHERGDVIRSEWLELDDEPRRGRAAPTRARLEQLAPSQAHKQDRSAGPLAEVLDEVEERRLGPMDVVENDDQRPLAGDDLQQAAYRPEGFACGGRSLGDPDDFRDAPRDLLGVVLAAELRAKRGQRYVRHGLAHDLGDRQIGRAGAVRHAAADEHGCFFADRHDELARETRLADPRLAHDRDDRARLLLPRALERIAQLPQLSLASDE